MATEYRLSYTANEINEKLSKIDEINSIVVSSSVVTLKVPILAEGATEYTDADKSSVQTAINDIAATNKPVVVLDYNGSFMPANYFVNGTHHYFTVIATDKVVDGSSGLYLVYIDYDTSNETLVVCYDVAVGGSGSGSGDNTELSEDIENLKSLVGDTSVSEQISQAISSSVADWNQNDSTADDYIKNRPFYTDGETVHQIDEKYLPDTVALTSDVEEVRTLVGDTSVADQIAAAVEEKVFVQNEEPVDAPEGSIWVDLDDDGQSNTPEKTTANVYVVDAATTDITTVDFSKYAIGDVILVTTS